MKKIGKVVAVVLLLWGMVILAYLFFDWGEKAKDISKNEVEEERKKWKETVEQLEADIADLRSRLEDEKPAVSSDRKSELFGPDFSLPWETEDIDCQELKTRVLNFFRYLDEREYIRDLKLQKTANEYYNKVAADLSQKIPIVSEVALDFETLRLNTIHFYRVLDKKNIQIIKKILVNEGENLEMVMGVFFAYFVAYDHCQEEAIFVPPPALRYEYAGFFLNTLGGKAYLFRRNSRIRILVTYYAILALHEANERLLNRHGIDIRPHLNCIIEEISARNDLLFQKEYLETLLKIQRKYPPFKTSRE